MIFTNIFSIPFFRGKRKHFPQKSPGGGLHIWDADIGSGWPEPFTVTLDIDAAGQAVRTTYGVGREEPQSADAVRDICLRAGLKPRELRQAEGQFYLRFEK